VGREELGEAIKIAEDQIAEQLGYYPAPKYVEQEVKQMTRHHRPDMWRFGARNARGAGVSVKTTFGKVISPGRWGSALVGTATTAGGTLVHDFAALTSTITLPTALTRECEIRTFITGHDAALEWEIRPPKSVTISGGNVVIVFDSWQLIDPTLWEAYPTSADFGAIDITVAGNHVTSVEVYRMYTDLTQASAVFFWEPEMQGAFCSCGGTGCAACVLTTQDGCIHIRDAELGLVVPAPATYNATTLAWGGDCYDVCRDPDFVKIYYFSGALSQRWLQCTSCDPLPDAWARAIANLATARIDRPFCECGSATPAVVRAQTDLARSGGDVSFNVPFSQLDNPFGTRWGEVYAWREVARVQDRVIGGGTW
jgi:hypothetical protein